MSQPALGRVFKVSETGFCLASLLTSKNAFEGQPRS